jgi:hypothetical protein
MTDRAAGIDIPVLVMHGEDDQICPFSTTGERSVKLLRQGISKSYPGPASWNAHHPCGGVRIIARRQDIFRVPGARQRRGVGLRHRSSSLRSFSAPLARSKPTQRRKPTLPTFASQGHHLVDFALSAQSSMTTSSEAVSAPPSINAAQSGRSWVLYPRLLLRRSRRRAKHK